MPAQTVSADNEPAVCCLYNRPTQTIAHILPPHFIPLLVCLKQKQTKTVADRGEAIGLVRASVALNPLVTCCNKATIYRLYNRFQNNISVQVSFLGRIKIGLCPLCNALSVGLEQPRTNIIIITYDDKPTICRFFNRLTVTIIAKTSPPFFIAAHIGFEQQ